MNKILYYFISFVVLFGFASCDTDDEYIDTTGKRPLLLYMVRKIVPESWKYIKQGKILLKYQKK